MNERTEIKKKYVFWQAKRMIGYFLTGMFVLLLAGLSEASAPGLDQMRIVCENIEKAIEETEYSETKIEIIDESTEYLQNVNKEVLIMREEIWKVANTFSGTKPVVLDDVRATIDVARKIEQVAGKISLYSLPIPKPELMPVKAAIKAVEIFAGLFAFFGNGMTKSLENLATGMHSANIQSMTLGELKDPLYPGLRRQECLEVYHQIKQAEVLARELGEVSSLLTSEVSKLEKIKQAIQEVEEKYSVWVKKVASTVDSQTLASKYNQSVFDSLRGEIEGVIGSVEGYLEVTLSRTISRQSKKS